MSKVELHQNKDALQCISTDTFMIHLAKEHKKQPARKKEEKRG
jgi:hypothetical protein